MDDIEARLHRTMLELLVAANYREIASIVLDGSIERLKDRWDDTGIAINVPATGYQYVSTDENIRRVLTETARLVASGRLFDQNGNEIPTEHIQVALRIKLLDVEADWQARIRELIINAKESNQGFISEKLFARKHKQVLIYNELKFASQAEIRIAQELERRKVLFFPLAVAVRADTGNWYKDHREVDFLVCKEGVWGVLEVSYHPDRYELDSEKNSWLMASGILCVKHYSSEKCYNQPQAVVDEYLSILGQHKR